ncbi:hypothetical protein OG394_27680 [Kribbella sp. NBC_01245]|uniref:hypothetical protein n=1 Tax=Kribbella sp. NBC_01245 TaxID=2903578 RepID=UPI002E2C0E97|nr:hypothetical protein [Kribbella sp. NBC_01245]
MTETELQSRLTATVADVEPPVDLLDRVRTGGSKRLRRRWLTAVATMAVATVAVGGMIAIGAGIESFDANADAAANAKQTTATDDPYAYFLNKPTKGNLAGDQEYLDEVLRAWDRSHGRSLNNDRGIFDHLKGEAHVVWAGETPAGPAAMVIQRAELRHHDNIQLSREGLFTLAGFIGMGEDGKPQVVADAYPAPGVGGPAMAFVVGTNEKALVVLDTGAPEVGVSMQREYPPTGGSTRTYEQLTFREGAAVVQLPPGATGMTVRVNTLPANGPGRIGVAYYAPGAPAELDQRVWPDLPAQGEWPASPGLPALTEAEVDAFGRAVEKASDEPSGMAYHSIWHAYAKTPNGDRVVVGEYGLDRDPSRIFAHVTSPDGKTKTVGGGIPQRDAPLPVAIRLPDGQGWLVAAYQAQLSYQRQDGTWSQPMPNALLVPDEPSAKVKVKVQGQEQIVPLG